MAPAEGIEPFYAELGQRIETIRRTKHLTQDELGQSLKPPLTRSSISNIEKGRQRVLAHVLANIAESLDVPIESIILNRKNQPPPKPRLDLQSELMAKLPPTAEVKSLAARLTKRRNRRSGE